MANLIKQLLTISFIFILFSMVTKKSKEIEYISNTDLPILKANWKGNVLIDDVFYNDTIIEERSIWKGIKWKLSKNPQKKEKQLDSFNLVTKELNHIPRKSDNLIWFGHSTFLINLDGISILTDPIFFSLPIGDRKSKIPIHPSKLRNIDHILISHNHFDHFDMNSMKIIAENNAQTEVLLPLRSSALLQNNALKKLKYQEAGWYQEYNLKTDLRIIFLPAKHWSRRGINDYNKSLWGSFLIISKNRKVFFAGDTGYDSKMFKEINALFGPIDECLLPIGAYSPTEFMKDAHVTPEESFKIFNELNGKTFIPIHYGTFDLSDEPLGEPLNRIKNCFSSEKLKHQLEILEIGEIYEFPK